MSRSLKREHSAWYSQVLLGLTSGGGVQHTLSLIPVKTRDLKTPNRSWMKRWSNGNRRLLTVNHVRLLHVALTACLTTVSTHSGHVVCYYSNLPWWHNCFSSLCWNNYLLISELPTILFDNRLIIYQAKKIKHILSLKGFVPLHFILKLNIFEFNDFFFVLENLLSFFFWHLIDLTINQPIYPDLWPPCGWLEW